MQKVAKSTQLVELLEDKLARKVEEIVTHKAQAEASEQRQVATTPSWYVPAVTTHSSKFTCASSRHPW